MRGQTHGCPASRAGGLRGATPRARVRRGCLRREEARAAGQTQLDEALPRRSSAALRVEWRLCVAHRRDSAAPQCRRCGGARWPSRFACASVSGLTASSSRESGGFVGRVMTMGRRQELGP